MLTTDYLIIGSGVAGMSFADQLLTETDAKIVIAVGHHAKSLGGGGEGGHAEAILTCPQNQSPHLSQKTREGWATSKQD